MDKEFVKDFHVLFTSKSPVIYHSPTHRFFELNEKSARVISSLETSEGQVSAREIEDAKNLLLREVKESTPQFKQNIMGNRPELTIFYLFVSQDCNLNCRYCYGDGGDYQKRRMLMTEDVADNFMNKLITGESNSYMINFFGGEPFLNLPLMKKVVRELREKAKRLGFNMVFNINTNGTLWNEEIRDFLKNDIDNITVSLDGPKEINDTQRVPRGDFSPHDLTVRMLKELKGMKGKNYLVRTVVTKNNYNKIGEVYRYNLNLSPGSVGLTTGDVDPSHPLALTDEEHKAMVKGIVKNNIENLLSFTTDETPQFYEYTYDLFELMFFKKYRPNPCNAGKAVAAVAADGDIYPCHRFVGFKEFCVGNVNNKEPLNEHFERIFREFRMTSVDSMDKCSRCWARYLCGGCCYVISYLREGSISTPVNSYCHLKKTVYHSLLTHFIEIMSDTIKKEKLVNNVKRLLKAKRGIAC